MKISEAGIDLIKSLEGFRSVPYRDVIGLNTVGYGHKMKMGEMCDSIAPEDAEKLLSEDLLYSEGIVNDNVETALNQNQFDALVSFVFNVGAGGEDVKDGFVTLRRGGSSSMLRCLNAGDFEGAAAQFLNWDHANGIVVEGLLERRQKEKELFESPVSA